MHSTEQWLNDLARLIFHIPFLDYDTEIAALRKEYILHNLCCKNTLISLLGRNLLKSCLELDASPRLFSTVMHKIELSSDCLLVGPIY